MDYDLPYSYLLCKTKTVFVCNKSFRDNQRPVNEAHKMVSCFIEIVHIGCSKNNPLYTFKVVLSRYQETGVSILRKKSPPFILMGVQKTGVSAESHSLKTGLMGYQRNQEKGFLRRMADIRGNDPVPSLDCPLFILQ